MAGKTAGIIANTRSGEPGEDGADILIRGKGTPGNTSPLIVVDGITDRSFSRLNPEVIFEKLFDPKYGSGDNLSYLYQAPCDIGNGFQGWDNFNPIQNLVNKFQMADGTPAEVKNYIMNLIHGVIEITQSNGKRYLGGIRI